MTFCAWIQLVCEKALCERAVKCLMGGLCPLACELHLSPGPCPWSLPNWLCRYACAQPGTWPILPLPCWLDFPVWPWDIPHRHRLVQRSQDCWVNLVTIIRPALLFFRYCGTAPSPVRSLPYLHCHSAAGLPSLAEQPTLAAPWQWPLRPRQRRLSESLALQPNYRSNWTVSKQ